jgi:Domain of unknown function (DUF6457)
MTLPDWSAQLCAELGIELDVDLKRVLDLARDAAHTVERPAAPVTTFLVGYAAGQRGGSEADVRACSDLATAFTARWAAEHPAANEG